jgi:2',3'-cyclic-nucleotide 2'-phosphodiesterase (5'-nucleotidase family)
MKFADRNRVQRCLGTLSVTAILVGVWTLFPQPSNAQDAGQTGRFRILFTANTLGYIEPCECTGGRFGGLARRAAAVKDRSGEEIPTLLIDLGNMFELPGRLQATELGRRQAGFLVDEMNRLGFKVQAIGAKELVFPKNFLRTYFARLETTPVLTNRAPDADIGIETVPVQRIVIGGVKLDIFNVIDPQMISREGVLVPWEEALREGLAESTRGSDPADLQVVISHMAIGTSDRMPAHFPEVDLILDGTLILPRQAYRIEDTVVMSTAGKGQNVGDLTMTAWLSDHRPADMPAILRFQGLQVRLPLSYRQDPDVRRRLDAFREELVKVGLIIPPGSF